MPENAQIASTKSDIPSGQQSRWTARVTTIQEAQRAIAAELILSATEMSESMRTEAQLWNELVSKLAEAHSVKNLADTWGECGRHQLDFARRETERWFEHGLHALEIAAGLLKGAKRDAIGPA